MAGIQAAVTRQSLDGKPPEGWMPEQEITVEGAVRADTVGEAYAEFQEDVKGSLMPGKLADLVMPDRNLYTMPPAQIDAATVVLTVVDGRVAFESRK